jgi:hypothetical protein
VPGYREVMSPTCSARGCQAEAVWSLLWNNPKLHTPERRKSWLACDEHRESLSDFLTARGLLRDTVAADDPRAGGAGHVDEVDQNT